MNRIKKFNESISDDSLHIEISREEYRILKHFLSVANYNLDSTGQSSFELNRTHSEDSKKDIKKFLELNGREEFKSGLHEEDYLEYIKIRLEEEFNENNI